MPGMMRSRKSGCMCVDCDGPRIADRASEKRDWQRWSDEYEPTADEGLTDWCPHDLRVCPPDTSLCCTAFHAERLRESLTAIREHFAGLGYEDVNDGPPLGRIRHKES